ncbi:hypothetical protein AMATHDRAFT_48559 [Amanita thiersii Skay4041]|uniref:Uncharacterized protein n=1 Tax=Amanita thiersii Skay4041 TaxID=703135 RepID=A0A2A9NHV3_9AGAR|nr:hypothetical protein AMATHDRAFT_48559 [Amanita thiersii Skay4041]
MTDPSSPYSIQISVEEPDTYAYMQDDEDAEYETDSDHNEIDPASQIPRPISPTPTEILEDPSPEEITANLHGLGIKIRDFALHDERRATKVQPATEIFDPFRGIAEFEYHVRQKAPRYSIAGKTVRRLIDLKWITESEVEERCNALDREALKRYDEKVAQDVKEGRGVYPWRSLRWANVPNMDQRMVYLMNNIYVLATFDGIRGQLEERDRMEEEMREQAEEDKRNIRMVIEQEEAQRMEDRFVGSGSQHGVPSAIEGSPLPDTSPEFVSEATRKRPLDDVEEGPGDKEYPEEGRKGDAKRIRSSPELEADLATSQSQSQRRLCPFVPPPKQYPAPLSSYDPKVYPEAASVINHRKQLYDQLATTPGETVSVPASSSPPTCCDVIMDAGEESSTSSCGSSSSSLGSGTDEEAKKPKRGESKRTLSRTQSFALL